MEKALELAESDYDLKRKYDFRRIEIIRDFPDAPLVARCTKTEIEQVVLLDHPPIGKLHPIYVQVDPRALIHCGTRQFFRRRMCGFHTVKYRPVYCLGLCP